MCNFVALSYKYVVMSYKVSDMEVRDIAAGMIQQLCLFHEKHHLTQTEIAKRLDMTTAQISRIATKASTPSASTLLGLFRLYNSLDMLSKRRDYNLPVIIL